jgi:hypothetical protein
MNCGTVVYDKRFQFPNGQIIDKLLIVLCEFGSDHLVLTTTSQPQHRKAIAGCQIKNKPPTFFLPKDSCWFDKDTWVELHVVNELPSLIHNQKKQDGTVIEYPNALPIELMKQILDCVLQSDFIDGYYLDHLQRVRDKLL